MDRRSKTHNIKKIALIIGFLLVCVTLLLNEQVLAGLIPDYKAATPPVLKITVLMADAIIALVIIFLVINRKPKARIILDVFVGIGFTLLLLVGIEAVFYYLNRKDPLKTAATLELIVAQDSHDVRLAGKQPQSFFQPDDWLGYKPIPNAQVAASRKKGEELLYDVIYSSDEYGRRVTPIENLEPVSYFVLLFGDSFAFGEGVNDNETLPYYVSQLTSGSRVYNYGVGGYGPQQMLAKLQSGELSTEIAEDKAQGILVYVFIRQHIGRVIGSMWVHNRQGDVMPYYYLDTNDTLKRNGNFVSGRPMISFIYNIAGKSQTLDYFGVSFPLRVSDRDLKTTAKIFEESRRLFKEAFNSDQFYVLIYPNLGIEEFLPYLEAADINYLDYSTLPEAHNEDFWLGEGHPTAKAHRIVAERLIEDLELPKESKE